MKKFSHFIIIDDDYVNNMLCGVIIRKVMENSDIKTFTIPEEGFDYLANKCYVKEETAAVLLDINMPGWTGWVFLEHFEKLSEQIKSNIKIYMLSSSVNPEDTERARICKNVVDFLIKPLTKEKVLSILS